MRTTIATTGERFAWTPKDTRTDAEGARWHLLQFDSLEDCLEMAMRRLPECNDTDYVWNSINNPRGHRKSTKDKAATWTAAEWLGVPSGACAEVIDALHNGWRPGADLVEELGQRLPCDLRPPVAQRRRASWSDAGDSVDMQRVWSGSLDRAWRRTRPAAMRATRPIRLCVQVSANFSQDAAVVAWRGVAALALSHLLTTKGFAVEIVGTMCNVQAYKNDDCLLAEILLKHTHKPLDVLTLAGPLTVLGFARHVGFALKAHGKTMVHPKFGISTDPRRSPFWQGNAIAGFEACCDLKSSEDFIRETLAELEAGQH